MMEYWKVEDPVFSGIGFKKISRFMNTFHLLVKRSVVNIPLPHFSRTHYSIVPSFHHSNWGEAPKFQIEHLDVNRLTG